MRRLILLISGLLLAANVYASSQLPVTSLAPMLKKTLPSVVNITTERPHNPEKPASGPHAQMGLASGVIVNAEKGYILTNEHVIHNAGAINVTLKDGRRFKAKLIGQDPPSDIALLQIKSKELTEISLADSDHLDVGDFVVAIGNPFGLNHSVTSGVISALGRSDLRLEGFEDFIQTDASINPGNSGGALVNLQGQLIGINTAILAPKGGNIGIGFAIPINMAENIMMQLIKFGEVRRGLLGVMVQTLTPELADAFNIPKTKGAIVDRVVPDSIAQKAGLMPGDVLIKVNDHEVSSASSVRNYIGLVTVGDYLNIALIRDGKKKMVRTRMLPPTEVSSTAAKIHPDLRGSYLGDFNQIMGTYGITQGVAILNLNPDSPAAAKGLQLHDVIVEANHKPVHNLAELIHEGKGKKELLLRVLRNNGAFYVAMKAPE